MSSAILYIAIVVIWACVLIPRWLRHSPASTVAAQAEDQAAADSTGEEESAPAVAPSPSPSPAPSPAPAPRRRREDVPAPRERRAAPAPVFDEAPAEPVGRRARSARRRLLLMLVALGLASGVLAGARIAAWWVVVPPSVMLLGYLPLLRAAAKADAERGEMARYRKAQAAEAARAPARRPVPAAAGSAAGSVASGAGASGARIITIPAAPEPAEEEIYDQYADAKLRAVGD